MSPNLFYSIMNRAFFIFTYRTREFAATFKININMQFA